MIPRRIAPRLRATLGAFPVVALLGPRQVGKTTLALELAEEVVRKPAVYLDLERDSDRSKLAEAELYLGRQEGRLVIIDEVQRRPELFPLLRSLVDERIRKGEPSGQFLVLGSASRDLLRQSSESLAGRIAYVQLDPFSRLEVGGTDDMNRHWLRGGYPRSFLATDDRESWEWRGSFIGTYLERDLPQLGLRMPAEQLRRFWTMLAHGQGDQLNAARLAAGLGVSGNTVRRYLDVLTDLYMVRQLPPWSGNLSKRLVKSPKVYVRDSGLLHRLANVPDLEVLLGHPLCGPSFEGFAIEQFLVHLPDTWTASYFRSAAQAEIDLVLEGPRGEVMAIEIKRTVAPSVSKGFRLAAEDVGATERYAVMPEGERHPIGSDTEAVSLDELLRHFASRWDV